MTERTHILPKPEELKGWTFERFGLTPKKLWSRLTGPAAAEAWLGGVRLAPGHNAAYAFARGLPKPSRSLVKRLRAGCPPEALPRLDEALGR